MAEKLRELIAKWHNCAQTCKNYQAQHINSDSNAAEYHRGGNEAFDRCAIELEAYLAESGAANAEWDARAFAECDGCGCSGFDPNEGANYAIQISDKNGQKYRPLGRFCPRCKDKEWAWQNHRYPDELYTKNEVLAGVGLEGVRSDSRTNYIERIKKWVAAGRSASGAQREPDPPGIHEHDDETGLCPECVEAGRKLAAPAGHALSERILCMECGKSVSTPVPKDTIVRAWVECPECIEKRQPAGDK